MNYILIFGVIVLLAAIAAFCSVRWSWRPMEGILVTVPTVFKR